MCGKTDATSPGEIAALSKVEATLQNWPGLEVDTRRLLPTIRLVRIVIRPSALFDARNVFPDPGVEAHKGTQKADAHLSQLIFDSWGDLWEVMPGYQSVSLQVSQR